MDNNEKYEYTYTAPTESERKTVEEIRCRYQSKERADTSFMRLKKLDGKVRSMPMMIGLSLGIIGTLLFGSGMAIVLEKLFAHYLLVGVTLSVVGLVPIALAYPTYCKVSKKYKEKYGDEILKLSDEILNENKV
ncbi:MAG: dihydropteridine reductase [Clostridia bacterium]|nr:dihydropteridine reductase [Clostridia bacterium]